MGLSLRTLGSTRLRAIVNRLMPKVLSGNYPKLGAGPLGKDSLEVVANKNGGFVVMRSPVHSWHPGRAYASVAGGDEEYVQSSDECKELTVPVPLFFNHGLCCVAGSIYAAQKRRERKRE